MSKFQRVISFIVAGIMTLSMIPAAFASNLPEDVVGTKYEESVELLQALEIMVGDKDTGNFRLEDGIIRSEVAKIAVLIAGLGDAAESSKGSTRFPDVVADHWATGYINISAAQGFVIGDDNGNFRPDDKITFAEAATIFTRVLGYDPSAIDKGGFPNGYIAVAGSIGLLKNGAASADNAAASRGIAALMAYNALTIDMMEKTGFGTNESYEVVNKNLLNDKLDVQKLYGQVTANSQTTLVASSSSLKDDQVQIKVDDKTDLYNTNGTDAADYIAQNVIVYVQETDDSDYDNIVLIRRDNSRTDELTIDLEDIDSVEVASDGSAKVNYWVDKTTDKKTTDTTIASDAKVFYNGLLTTFDIANIDDLSSGHITMYDTDRSDEYNYIFITEYKNIVVDDVSLVSNKISDKYNLMTLTLDPKDKNYTFKILKDGKEISIDQIKEWDILSVAMDKPSVSDSTKFTVYVSTEKVTGKVTEIEEDEYTIGDKTYKIAANYLEANQPDIELNDEGVFYLDIEGKIAAVDTESIAGSNYAYLVDADVTGTLNNKLQLKLFTKEGETVIVDAPDKLKINNVSNLEADNALDALKEANDGEVMQLITYEVNSDGQIYYINTATDNTTAGTAMKNTFSLDYSSDEDSLEYKASTSSNKLGKYNVNSDTLVLEIPEGETDSDNYSVRTIDMFVDKTSYNVDIYDLSEDLTAKVVIVKDSKGEVNAESSIAVVTKVTNTQNSDSQTVHKLYAVQNGKEIQLLAKDTDTLVKNGSTVLSAGDIIQYRTNSKNEIDKISVLFDNEDISDDSVNIYKDYEGTDMETVIGTVTKKFSNSINVVAENLTETNYNISNANIYEYDFSKTNNNKVSVVDSSYITKYDEADPQKVFLRIYKGVVTDVVIIQSK